MWEYLFEKNILRKGKEYFSKNKVQILSYDGNIVHAFVTGSRVYALKLEINEYEEISMQCDCKYAMQGENCVHMAAALYKLFDEKDEESNIIKVDFSNDDMEQSGNIIEKAIQYLELNKDASRYFFEEYIKANPSVASSLVKYIEANSNNIDIKVIKLEIRNTINQYKDIAGYINYNDAIKLKAELQELINRNVEALLAIEEYENIINISLYAIRLVCSLLVDDFTNLVGDISQGCKEIIEGCLTKCNIRAEERVLKDIEKRLRDASGYNKDILLAIVIENFYSPDLLNDKLECIDKQLDILEEGHCYKAELVVAKIEAMELLNINAKEVMELAKVYWANNQVRKYFTNKAIINKEYAKAIKILQESKLYDKGRIALIREHNKALKDIYKIIDDKKGYSNLLLEELKTPGLASLKAYIELKEAYDINKWAAKREEVFNFDSCYPLLHSIYNYEKLYDRLIAYILNNKGIDLIEKYEDTLASLYPSELLDKYELELNIMIDSAKDRKMYKRFLIILRRMQGYPNGEDKVKQIVTSWKAKFNRRLALINELENFTLA